MISYIMYVIYHDVCAWDNLNLSYIYYHRTIQPPSSIMAMQTITSLPLETFSLILDYLPPRDLLSLYAVSKSFLCLIAPRVFSTLTVRSPRDVHDQLLVLKSISTSSSNIIAPAVKTLHIKSLYHTYARGKIDEAVTLEYLVLCLTKLQNLETVK